MLIIVIVVACVVGGCGKIVEGVAANAIREHNHNCVRQAGKCGRECGTNLNCSNCCYFKAQDCFWHSTDRRGPAITEEDINFCKSLSPTSDVHAYAR